METKNAIILNYANALQTTAGNATMYASALGDNADENRGIIATLNVVLEAIRSQTVLLQQALDNYI